MKQVKIKHIIATFLAVMVLQSYIPLSVFALDDSLNEPDKATLNILAVSSGSNVTFTYPTSEPVIPPGVPDFLIDQIVEGFYSGYSIWPFTDDTCSTYSYSLDDNMFDYYCKSRNGSGMGQMNVIAEPQSDEANVNVYATANRNMNYSQYMENLTGKARLNPYETKPYNNDGGSHQFYQFVSTGGDNFHVCTFRIEVTEDDVTNNYNVVCLGANGTDYLTELKNAFAVTVDEQTDVSSFVSGAKTLVETAKPIYKARMDAATDAMEACKIANEFNIIVCQAKDIEDEYAKLNDKVTDAEDALSGISTAVKNSAIKAADAAEALDLTDYSEEDAEAITTAAEALKAVLEDDEATLEDILNAKEALEEAMYSAEDSALAEKKSENDDLRAKIAELTQAKEDAEAKLDDTEKKLDETKEKLAKAEKALIDDAAGKVVASAEKYIDAAKADLEKAAQAIAENAGAFAEDTAKKFFAKAAEAIKAATKGLEQVNGTLSEGNNRIEDLKSQLKELSETIKSGVATEAEVASLNKQLEEAKDELEQAKADLAKNEGISSELEQLKAELEKANAELAKATKPEQVTANSAKAGKKKVTVKWTALDGAEGYVVYRSLKKNKGFKAVKTIKKAKIVKLTDKKVKKGKKYFYKVRAYKMYDGNKLFGAYSKVLKTAKVK